MGVEGPAGEPVAGGIAVARALAMEMDRAAQDLMLVSRSRLSGQYHLVRDAPVRESCEGSALGLPCADRGDQSDPGLLREILALAAKWRPDPPGDPPDERFILVNDVLDRCAVSLLGGLDQPSLGIAGEE